MHVTSLIASDILTFYSSLFKAGCVSVRVHAKQLHEIYVV